MHIHSETRLVASLTSSERATMFGLLSMEFLGVRRSVFQRDLEEKESVIVLREEHAQGAIVGFSTLMTLDLPVQGRHIKAVFSGDTAVLPSYRRSMGIGVEALGYFVDCLLRFPEHEIFHVLISKGWRTYKILPFFYREFSPRYDASTPHGDKAVIDAFGKTKYPKHYLPKAGLIMFASETQRIPPGSTDATPRSLDDPHTRFFLKMNPTYLSGTELVCVAQVAHDNFTKAAARIAVARSQRRAE